MGAILDEAKKKKRRRLNFFKKPGNQHFILQTKKSLTRVGVGAIFYP